MIRRWWKRLGWLNIEVTHSEEAMPMSNHTDDAYADGFQQGHAEGYDEGKGKAHFEVRDWRPGAHTGDCGCEPCITVRTIAKKLQELPGAWAVVPRDGC